LGRSISISGTTKTFKNKTMIIALLNFFKGRFDKDSIQAAKNSEKRMSRQEAFQQMRELAKKSGKKN
jgi:hypothetical protein